MFRRDNPRIVLTEIMLTLLAILASGILGAVIYPSVFWGYKLPDMGFLAWIYLIPLYFALDPSSLKKNFKITWITSLIFYGIILYWIMLAITNFGGLTSLQGAGVLIVLVGMMATFFAGFLSLAQKVVCKTNLPFFLVSTVFLVASDYARTYFPAGGFHWALPGYSQGNYLGYFQWIEWTGVFGLNAVIYLVNGLLFEVLRSLFVASYRYQLVSRLIGAALVMLVSVVASLLVPSFQDFDQGREQRELVGLVQGNIPQDIRWDYKHAQNNIKKHVEMTQLAAEQGVGLVIWPETAYPFTVDLDWPVNLAFSDNPKMKTHVILGAVSSRGTDNSQIYNSAFFLDDENKVLGVYHKRHLVPFGEYIPFQTWLSFAGNLTKAIGEFIPGRDAALFHWKNDFFGTLICYEDIFPDLARQSTLAGATVLVNMTNDAWYGNTSGQYQHLVYSQMRALENRRFLLRATNTGVTAIIDARGKVTSFIPPWNQTVLLGSFVSLNHKTFYTRYGDWVVYLAIFMVFIFILISFVRRKQNGQ